MFRVVKKLVQVKRALSKWCKESLLSASAEDARIQLDRLQLRLRLDSNDPILVRAEKSARENVENLLRVEESMMKQKSRDRNLYIRDSNTKFFYSLFKANRKKSLIQKITDANGTTSSNPDFISSAFLNHFRNILAPIAFPCYRKTDLAHINVSGKLSMEDQASVATPVTVEAIEKAIK